MPAALPDPPPQPQPPSPARLLELWRSNADPWAHAVRSGGIESRRVATDRAVVDEVLRHRPARVLDVGCGEGWLARELSRQGVAVLGIDPVPALIEQARAQGGAEYAVAGFADLQAGTPGPACDLWVCNFSLFHESDAPALLAAARRHLPPQGTLVIQTLHANATPREDDEPDGWQLGNWGACGSDFAEPIPWYFRRLASWQALIGDSGLMALQVLQPSHPQTGRPLSWLFTARQQAA